MRAKEVIKTLVEMKTILLSIFFPLILLPILFSVEGDVGRCTYAVILMILLWVFEVLPIPITSLLPVFLFPVLGVMTTGKTAAEYVKNITITVIAIFGIVAAVEKWELHRRIALGILILFGTKPHWLILGVLASTAFLSMIITAGVTILMLPIAGGIIENLRNVKSFEDSESKDGQEEININNDETTSEDEVADKQHEDEIARLSKALTVSLAYGTSLGSSIFMTGSPSNFVMVGLTEDFYEEYGMESPVTFISWFVFAFPLTVIILIFTWLWFVAFFLRGKGVFRRSTVTDSMEKAQERVKEHLRNEYKSLGPMSYQEAIVLASLLLMVILFLTQDLYFVSGWGSLFRPKYVRTSVPAIMVLVLLFIIPAKSPRQLLSCNSEEEKGSRFAPILHWRDVNHTTPWGLILLLGAAFSIVKATQESGLLDRISLYFETFATLDPIVLTVAVTSLTTFATEFVSNSSTITLLLPIVANVAILANMDPLSLIFPLTLAAKFAFMMPIATVPNAVVFSLGTLEIKDMASVGLGMNVITLILLNIAAQTYGKAYFAWDILADEMRANSTLTGNVTGSVSS